MSTVYSTLQSFLGALPEVLLHPKAPKQPPWRLWPWVLALAFLARAGIAISGDFILHPDEILQYLEPAHRAVWGHGVVYWEYFYGGRQWFIPGLVAAVLGSLKAVNLTDPWIYTDVVKLLFCGISLGIPAGMYFFARRHFEESSARIALVAGSFWYELVGFAHKPMAEFVSTSILMIALVFLIAPHENRNRTVYGVACLGMLAAGIRFQYAPLVIVLLGLFSLKTHKKILLMFTAITLFFAIGIFDGWTWNQGIFHSYLANFRYNSVYSQYTMEESSVLQYLWWLLLASSGFSAVLVLLAARFSGLRRYGFLLGIIALILILHSVQSHREYRFIFMVIPLWLMIAADFIAHLFHKTLKRHDVKSHKAAKFDQLQKYLKIVSKSFPVLLVSVFSLLSLAGILNLLPRQSEIYRAWAGEPEIIHFIRGQDPIFAAYRYLSNNREVFGIWQADRLYLTMPNYYYFHHKIPIYDHSTGRSLVARDLKTLTSSANHIVLSSETLTLSVSHIILSNPNLHIRGYITEKEFGNLRILRREHNDQPVRQWKNKSPIIITSDARDFARKYYPDFPAAPPTMDGAGIQFVDQAANGQEHPQGNSWEP